MSNQNDTQTRDRIRALRRARRYIKADQGKLARLINTYVRVADLDPTRRIWSEQ